MAFETLAERFEKSSQQIYTRFAAKQTPESKPYISIIPDSAQSRNRIKEDTRSVPVVSTLRDQNRVSKFLRSSDGLLFISKQALLQTGNTFVNTKLFNPLSTQLSAIPFLHPRRHIVQNTLRVSVPGLLQNTTVNTISNKFDIVGSLQTNIAERGLLKTIGSVAKSYLATQLKNAANAVLPIPQNYLQSRPEYNTFNYNIPGGTGPILFDPQPLDQRGIARLSISANIKAAVATKVRSAVTNFAKTRLNLSLPKALRGIVPVITDEPIDQDIIKNFEGAAAKFRQNFYDKNRNITRLKSRYFGESSNGVSEAADSVNRVFAKPSRQDSSQKYRDSYNVTSSVTTLDENTINYGNVIKEQEPNSDIIKFIFREADDSNPVYFRALLSSIKESIKTEFNEQRYVGRTERFVTYGGAKRSVNLGFNVVAFSKDEIDGVWTKINYLSGLAFPKDVQNGFMVPPLFKITIGGIYENQPCYIETLDYDFLDESITFDIDKEVPFAVNVTMQLSLFEKRSKFYDSPFYKITENITGEQYLASAQERADLRFQQLERFNTSRFNQSLRQQASRPVTTVRLPENFGNG